MNWDQHTPYPLNRTSVLHNAKEVSGVYGLRNGNSWVYVGQCPNVQRALLDYLGGKMPYVLQFQPNVFVFEPCPPRNRTARQRELVQIYRPACNKKIFPEATDPSAKSACP
jgi:hypothetical protein